MEVDSILKENEEVKAEVEKRKVEGDINFHKQIGNQIANLYEQLFFTEDSKIDIIDKSNMFDLSIISILLSSVKNNCSYRFAI